MFKNTELIQKIDQVPPYSEEFAFNQRKLQALEAELNSLRLLMLNEVDPRLTSMPQKSASTKNQPSEEKSGIMSSVGSWLFSKNDNKETKHVMQKKPLPTPAPANSTYAPQQQQALAPGYHPPNFNSNQQQAPMMAEPEDDDDFVDVSIKQAQLKNQQKRRMQGEDEEEESEIQKGLGQLASFFFVDF